MYIDLPSPASAEPAQRQRLQAHLSVPDRGGVSVSALVRSDHDPITYGLDLIFPTTPPSTFKGFPVCEATVQTEKKGYASVYGWTQLWRSSKDPEWAYDWPPAQEKLDWPFVWFGPEPRLFDGPMRIGAIQLDWTARSFLTYAGGSVMSRSVTSVFGFEWGFQVRAGTVSVKSLKKLGPADWNEHVGYLGGTFPTWAFETATEQGKTWEFED
ncbi:hypothetical protein Daus18300_012329 [Diaporthe australafricana]|uniref:Uncharacterized protein n=1 Tax=Diaporthe australafricana TaxID=127596 RepID=A0ABR3W373_9PEZI